MKIPKRRSVLPKVLLIFALLFGLTGGGFVGWRLWQANQRPDYQPGEVVVRSDDDNQQELEGEDRQPLPMNALDDYSVPEGQPRIIRIAKLGVEARILPMGVNQDGSMQAPINIHDAGWYQESAKPGQAGAVLVDGHASNNGDGLFGGLNKLEAGDIIEVEVGGGQIFTYEVVDKESTPLEDTNMEKFVKTYGDNREGLNLMTCEGNWINNGQTMDHRLAVYAVRVT